MKKRKKRVRQIMREMAFFTLIGLVIIGLMAYMASSNFAKGDWLWGIVFTGLGAINIHSLLRLRKSSFALIEVIEETDKLFDEYVSKITKEDQGQ